MVSNATAKYLAFFSLAATLTGCAGGAASNSGPGGSGGSEPSGGTETGAAGQGGTDFPSSGSGTMTGTGGTGTMTSTGGTGTTTDTGGTGTTTGTSGGGAAAPSACALGCESMGGACVNDECLFADKTLLPSVQESSYLDTNGLTAKFANAHVSFFPAGTVYPSFTVLGSDGPCSAVTYPGPPGDVMFDVGTITVEGTKLPSTTLTTPKYHHSFANNPEIFGPGDTVAFTVAGGPDFPAFTAEATAPEDVDLVVPTIHVSQPLTITWSPSTPLSYLTIFTSNKGIVCVPTAPGSLEVPVSLLALLDPPAAAPHAIVTADRRVSVAANVGSPGATARVMVGLSRILQVNYEP